MFIQNSKPRLVVPAALNWRTQVVIWQLTFFLVCAIPLQGQDQQPIPAAAGSVVATFVTEIEKVQPLLKGKWTKSWLQQAAALPPVEPHMATVSDREVSIDESLFYIGRYGSPLAYARALDLAEKFGFAPTAGARVFDFGYGSIGHLKMFGLAGLQATGVDVDPLLPVLYAEQSGTIGNGSVTLLDGKFPAEPKLVEQAGEGFDLFLSKNTLKRGYIHPSREPANPRHVIDLGVTDEQFLTQVVKMLKPQGLFVIYNFCPPKSESDKPYVPWAEGESPFTREQLIAAGFEILAFDEVDNTAARELAHQLGWDGPDGMQLESDLFAWYTITKKK